ncbi:MAG: nucleotidyltransferase domain-containing protein [Oligoflexia bacterium]|nr:nucleotidyltransferase domain-containing protein [Oligoflexia bacterium]
MNQLEKLFSSKVRAEICGLLFDEPKELHMREIERKTGLAIGTIQQDLKVLSSLDLVASRRDGNRLYYSANREHPLYPDIHNLVVKTVGMIGTLKKALSYKSITCAFIFGSVARQEEKAKSDIDLFVVGDLGLRKLSEILSKTKTVLDREINPHVMTEEEFAQKRKAKDHFVTQILKGEKIFIKGSDDELKTMG